MTSAGLHEWENAVAALRWLEDSIGCTICEGCMWWIGYVIAMVGWPPSSSEHCCTTGVPLEDGDSGNSTERWKTGWYLIHDSSEVQASRGMPSLERWEGDGGYEAPMPACSMKEACLLIFLVSAYDNMTLGYIMELQMHWDGKEWRIVT